MNCRRCSGVAGQARNNFYEINKISWLQDKYDVTL
jgi:hypothetical protein